MTRYTGIELIILGALIIFTLALTLRSFRSMDISDTAHRSGVLVFGSLVVAIEGLGVAALLSHTSIQMWLKYTLVGVSFSIVYSLQVIAGCIQKRKDQPHKPNPMTNDQEQPLPAGYPDANPNQGQDHLSSNPYSIDFLHEKGSRKKRDFSQTLSALMDQGLVVVDPHLSTNQPRTVWDRVLRFQRPDTTSANTTTKPPSHRS